MTTTQCPEDQLALYSRTGEAWLEWEASEQSRPLTWEASELVTKIVIGTPPTSEEKNEIQVNVPDNLATLYPNLTHLHLWQISSLQQLPELPIELTCLDVRGCGNLGDWGGMPQELPKLETLLLDGSNLPAPPSVAFPALRELSLKRSTNIKESWVHDVLRENAQLQTLDASGCRQLTSIPVLPAGLCDMG